MKQLSVILLLSILAACNKSNDHHVCRWDLCPYKGITSDQWSKSVSAYTGQINTDAYCIDMLHLQYPSFDYDQLEELMSK